MPVTPNFAIPYPDGTTPYTPVQNHFAAMAAATDDALVAGLGGSPRIAYSDSERTTLFPAPIQGNTLVRPDKGYTEQWFGLFDSGTNPGGASVAGWYPISGLVPGFYARNTATQTVTTAASLVTFPTPSEIVNRGNISLAATGVATIVVPGVYRIYGQGTYASAALGSRVMSINKNGAAVLSSIQVSANITTLTVQHELTLAAGDTISLGVISGNTVTLGVGGNAYFQAFHMDYVAPPR